MKKKLLALFIAIVTLFACTFAFTACDKIDGTGTNDETNKANDEVTDPIVGTWKIFEIDFNNGHVTHLGEDTLTEDTRVVKFNSDFTVSITGSSMGEVVIVNGIYYSIDVESLESYNINWDNFYEYFSNDALVYLVEVESIPEYGVFVLDGDILNWVIMEAFWRFKKS